MIWTAFLWTLSLKPELQRDIKASIHPDFTWSHLSSNRSHYCMLPPCCLYSRWVEKCPPEITASQRETVTRGGQPCKSLQKKPNTLHTDQNCMSAFWETNKWGRVAPFWWREESTELCLIRSTFCHTHSEAPDQGSDTIPPTLLRTCMQKKWSLTVSKYIN